MLRQILCAIILASLSTAAIAQPTLTSAINPQPGDNWSYHYVVATPSPFMPGPAGANQTWTFAGFADSATALSSYIACPAVPECDAFPGTSVVFDNDNGDSYEYYKADANVYATVGFTNEVLPNEYNNFPYSDQEDLTRYPVAYNDAYTDSWTASHAVGTFINTFSGNTTVTADAYGTITTPEGTFENTLRIHRHQVYTSYTNTGTSEITYNFDVNSWAWYSPLKREAVFVYTNKGLSGEGLPYSYKGQTFYTSSGLGVSGAPVFAVTVRTFPNPASGVLTVLLDTEKAENATISLQDMTGRTVATVASQDFAAGTHQVSLDVSKMPAAVYALTIRSADGRQVARRVQVL